MGSRYAKRYAAWRGDPLNFWADTMKKIADGDAWTMPATIDDPAVMSEISAALQGRR